MQAIVQSGQRMRQSVKTKSRATSNGLIRIQTEDTSAAMKMPVPVADSQLKTNTAGSRSVAIATGSCRATCWCRFGTSNFWTVDPVSVTLKNGVPQRNTKQVNNIHG